MTFYFGTIFETFRSHFKALVHRTYVVNKNLNDPKTVQHNNESEGKDCFPFFLGEIRVLFSTSYVYSRILEAGVRREPLPMET